MAETNTTWAHCEEGYQGTTAAEIYIIYRPSNMTDRTPIRDGQTVSFFWVELRI
jgi:hypothetical protein